MRWLFLVLLASTCLAQPVEGPYLILSDTTDNYFGRPFFIWQDSITARVYHGRTNGDSAVWSVRYYSLTHHRFTVWEDVLRQSVNQEWMDAVVIEGNQLAILSISFGRAYVHTWSPDTITQSYFYFNCAPSGSTFGTAYHFLHSFDNEWTFGWFRGSIGWDGSAPAQCGFILNIENGNSEVVLSENHVLDIPSPGPDFLRIVSLGPDSFAVFHNNSRDHSSVSLVGSGAELADSMIRLDWSASLDNVLDVEWLGDTQFKVIGTDRPESSVYTLTRDISIPEQSSLRVAINGGFSTTDFCRVPGFGWALIELEQDTIRLLRVSTDGIATQDPEAVVVAPHEMELEWARVASDPSGNLFVYYGEVTPEYPFYRNVKYVSLHWNTPLSSDESSPSIPQEFSLTTYPNPFNSTVRIDYELPRAGDVQLSIYNTLGEEVATLFDGRSNAGTHSLTWSPNSASGVYFVKLEAGTFVKTQKVLYIR